MYVTCPHCEGETVRVDVRRDSDGLHDFLYLADVEAECGCELGEEDQEVVETAAIRAWEASNDGRGRMPRTDDLAGWWNGTNRGRAMVRGGVREYSGQVS